jgi:hypothetical protein
MKALVRFPARTCQSWDLLARLTGAGGGGWGRVRPFANAANSYIEFPAGMYQKFGRWINVCPFQKSQKVNHLDRKLASQN